MRARMCVCTFTNTDIHPPHGLITLHGFLFQFYGQPSTEIKARIHFQSFNNSFTITLVSLSIQE